MKKKLYQLLSVLMLIAVLCSSCSFSRSVESKRKETTTAAEKETDSKKNPENQKENDRRDSPEAVAEQEAFDNFTDELFFSTLEESVLSVYSVLDFPEKYGITEYEYTLGSISEEENEKDIEELQNYLDTLKDFEYDYLTDDQQFLYDILVTDLEDSIELNQYYWFNEFLSPLNGIPSSIPSYLSQFSFNNATSVKDYIEIMKLLPAYYDNMMEYEKAKADRGMGLPDFELDEAIDQCNQFISDVDNHFLITTFNDRIAGVSDLSDADKQAYMAQNEDLIKNSIIPAYQKLIQSISELKGKCVNEGGLCNFEDGKDYYEILVRTETGSDKSVSEIKEMLSDKLEDDLSVLYQLTLDDAELYDKMDIYPVQTSDPDEILGILLEKIKEDFPEGYETNYTINDVPKALEKYQSPAYYYIPSIDNLTVNNIFINRYTDYADMDLYPVLAHEGFPGHMYQSTYFQNTKPDKIRSLLRYTGYLEGWGLYAELYSYRLTGQDSNVAQFNQVMNCISYDVCCLADIGINYEGWTREEAVDFITSVGYEEEAGNNVYEALVEDPCSYFPYYIGYLEFIDMRTTAKKELGEHFNIKEFHKFILDIGPAQFEIIHDYFDDWIEKEKTSA